MGADNSKTTRRQDSNELHRDLQYQEEEYAEKYMAFVQSQIEIHESIKRNRNRSHVPPVPSNSSRISPPSTNINSVNTTHYDARPYFSSAFSSTPSTSSHISTPTTNINSEIPSNSDTTRSNFSSSTSSTSPHSSLSSPPTNAVTPSNNTNAGNIHNRGAIPKSRKVPDTRMNSSPVGVKCVTCNTDFNLQIYQCRNGHSSCNLCKFIGKNCGRCSMPITAVRNITLETIIADMKTKNTTTTNERIKCRNASIGCCLSFTIHEMDNHLQECPYTDMECPLKSIFNTCAWKGKINDIYTHFKSEHPDNCVADVDKEMALRNINKDQTYVYYVKIGQFNFIIYIELNNNKRTLSMTAQLLGTKVSASKWTYEFIVYNKNNPQRQFQYNDVCYSTTAMIKEIFNNQQCATVNAEYAKTFVNRGCLTYKFFLKRNSQNNSKNSEKI
ncbi:E3 ubiquitin-protein ligase Siah2-like isoform X2 [Vanessa cardui]|uniref:E3 ubiquitin-protein ligase Siah2-like isoform X2 n=1 Tax=Vanessa cardui TaxID=171605 RepID=UPI001F130777|nr:E3 ubiquitin-protein ligase Siah2-like isoform X2 [Vanessa cardui]